MLALKDMEYQIEMIFCHTGNQNMEEYAFRPVNDLLYQVNEDDSVKLLIFDEIKNQNIYDYLANGQNGTDINLNDVLLSNWGVIETPFKAYYGTIPASAIGEWYKLYGNRLFAKNIRYYKGSTDVNQGMKDVLKNQPENFFYYNNGLKILCKKISRKIAYSTDRTNGLFALEGVSLVNGAQTTGAIGSVYMENPEMVCNAHVFIQMIDLEEADEEQVVQITKLSNTQNKIEGKDFVSLDPQQERLRMLKKFEAISTGRKKLVLIHGNRFLLHLVLLQVKVMEGFNEQYLNHDYINGLVELICQKYWNKVYDAMERDFADAYPAHIFKNLGRIKQIADVIV